MSPRLGIFGTGALGSLLAARLGETGSSDVTVVGTWSEALDAMRTKGITFVGNAPRTIPIRAEDRATLARGGVVFDLVIVAVKSFQTADIAPTMGASLAPDGLAITLQNGLGNREILADAVGASRVAVGTTAAAATLEGPARVRFGGDGGTWLASPTGMPDDPRVGQLGDLLRRAGFAVERHDDGDSLLWSKVAVNCAINPLTALSGLPNGALLETPARRDLVSAIAAEVGSVARAAGVHLREDPASRALAVAQATAGNRSSMLQDRRAGRRTEIESLSGAVVREGTLSGVATPLNSMLADAVRDADRASDPAFDAGFDACAIDRFLAKAAA